MEWNQLEPNRNVIKFNHQKKSSVSVLGGILRSGSWAWIAERDTLQIVSLKSGQMISSYTFSRGIYNCNSIVCVTELFSSSNIHDVILAICMDCIPSNSETAITKSSIFIYSVEHGSVISWIKFESTISCMRFLSPKSCRRSLVQHFDGCLAVGTQEGTIFTIDMYLNYLLNLYGEKQKQFLVTEATQSNCHIVDYNLPLVEIHRTYKKILRERSIENVVHFGVRMEAMMSPRGIKSLLPIALISGLAVGLDDGRLIIYDMSEMQILYSSEHNEESSLLKMDFLEPTDDPRACFYILALHGDGAKVVTCLYTFMYDKRLVDERGDIYFENFLYGATKLEMLLGSNTSTAITCQAITKPPKNTDEDATCLFAISWNSVPNEETKLLIFDINQWYKEEMPRALSAEQAKSCLATFKIKNQRDGLDAFLNPATISHFNSMQRCEEHFYPNSLSFDWMLLDMNNNRAFNWPGIQNKTLNMLRSSTASLFLEPDIMFEKIRMARLLPQFTELNVNALFSQNSKYEVILSVALEHNCMGLLKDCARSWADGSFTCNNVILPSAGAELSLKTLQNWIWKSASNIKLRSNQLCEGLLSSNGLPLDQREKKELGFITRQLRSLAEIFDEVMQHSSKFQSDKAKDESFHLAADYQELLIWLINIGLLPERSRRFQCDDMPTTSSVASKVLSIYPYKQLRDYYIKRRLAIAKLDECYISKKSGSCRLIFIDAFVEHECMIHTNSAGSKNNDSLRENWLLNGGNGLYPPANIESMLRIMLLSSVSYESKFAILFYFFMDLHVALTDEDCHGGEDIKELVENFLKFPSVFKLSPSLTKTLQAFWHLDHGNIVAAVDEFLSPFNYNRKIDQWLIELMVESLLLQNGAHLALRILDAHSSLIAPSLKLSTLLANNLIAEAFHFVRSKDDVELMKRFFTSCLKMGKLGVIRDLALNEHEGKIVENLLRRIQLPGAENLHFVYLLQKSKYIEAVTYMDELSKGKSMRYASGDADTNSIDAPYLVISAFNTTMAPVTQTLTDVYFRIRNKIKQKETQNRSPVPLSCQLIKQNANNLLGGIYHSSALSAHFATRYYDEELQYGRRNVRNCHERVPEICPLSANNAPFLRKPQTETCREAFDRFDRQNLCYPQEFKVTEKRRISEVQNDDTVGTNSAMDSSVNLKSQQPNKKRRLLGEDFITSFKHFQKNNIILDDTEFNFTNEQPVNESFLTQPLTSNEKSERSYENLPKRALVSNDLHSILKSNTPEPTEQRTRIAETPAMEEKTIRFKLPPDSGEQRSENTTKEIESDAKNHNIDEPQAKHRVVTRSISSESHSDDVNITQYYSTLSTQDQLNLTTSLGTASVKDSGISVTVKPLSSQNSESVSFYQSARGKSLSPTASGPKPRKPILRMSAEPEQNPEKHLTIEPKFVSLKNPTIYEKHPNSDNSTSSGIFGPTKVPELLKITSVTTLTSAEFAPQICSSKVGDAQAKSLTEQLKMSERSTIVSGVSVSDMELRSSVESRSELMPIQPRPSLLSIQESNKTSNFNNNQPSLDTTLGMSSYDITEFDGTTVNKEKFNDETTTSSNDQYSEETSESIDEEGEGEESEEVIELLSSSENENYIDESEDVDSEETSHDTTKSSDSDSEAERSLDDIVNIDEVSKSRDDLHESENENISENTESEGTSHDTTNSNDSDSDSEAKTNLVDLVNIDEVLNNESTDDIILQQDISHGSDDYIVKHPDMSTHPGTSKSAQMENIVENIEIKSNSPVGIVLTHKETEIINKTTGGERYDTLNWQVLETSWTQIEGVCLKKSAEEVIEKIQEVSSIYTDGKFEESLKSSNIPLEMEMLNPKSNHENTQNLPISESTEAAIEESATVSLKNVQGISDIPTTKNALVLREDENALNVANNDKTIENPIIIITEFDNKREEEKECQNVFVEPEHKTDLTNEKNSKDLDLSDCFETPNASFHSIKEIDSVSPNIESPSVVPEAVDKKDKDESMQTMESSLKSIQKLRKRGQSLPPQPLMINEEECCIEIDSRTPKSRRKRGISVPPQTIESVMLTPILQKKPSLSRRRKSVNEDEIESSPKSPNSSRSGREIQKRVSAATPQHDSPALRTRSRLRTISESSDATVNSLNSPAISAKKTRRSSISSNISEHLHQVLTPKRSRRNSQSGQSDTEGGTPQSVRRLVLKEKEPEGEGEDEETSQKIEKSNTEIGIDFQSRRLTRTQRALLEKSEQARILLDNTKDDQVSVSSKTSQTSAQSKRQRTRSTSIKSNDDNDDDRASITSSVTSETRRSSRRLRAQQQLQQHSPSANLTSIPEDDVIEDAVVPSKRNKTVKK